jgi:hypothetical protein
MVCEACCCKRIDLPWHFKRSTLIINLVGFVASIITGTQISWTGNCGHLHDMFIWQPYATLLSGLVVVLDFKKPALPRASSIIVTVLVVVVSLWMVVTMSEECRRQTDTIGVVYFSIVLGLGMWNFCAGIVGYTCLTRANAGDYAVM